MALFEERTPQLRDNGPASGIAESQPSTAAWWWLVIAAGLIVVPFLNKPVHMDDTNFLVLSEGAAQDFWRPHAITINWDGTSRPAFVVLANPPGIAWWLLPVRRAPLWVAHLWIAVWLIPGLWGTMHMGRIWGQDGVLLALLTLTSPVVVLSTHSLGPDLAVWACAVAGIAGFIRFPAYAWCWALVAGASGIFKYSGACIVPLIILIGLEWGGWKRALTGALAAVPLLLLAVHDILAYGQVHFVEMFLFQNEPHTTQPLGRLWNGLASLGMLGGAVILPLSITGIRGNWKGWLVGFLIGANTVLGFHFPFIAASWNAFCIASGVAVLMLNRLSTRFERVCAAWSLGGLVFMFALRFAATRYWIVFQPGIWLTVVQRQKSQHVLVAAAGIQLLLSLGLAVDDYLFAVGYRDAAATVSEKYGNGTFAGHWGWQYYMQTAGWTPVERHGPIAHWHAVALMADPQSTGGDQWETVETLRIPDPWWGPRIHSAKGCASYYCNSPGHQTFVPWTLANDDYDQILMMTRSDRDHVNRRDSLDVP